MVAALDDQMDLVPPFFRPQVVYGGFGWLGIDTHGLGHQRFEELTEERTVAGGKHLRTSVERSNGRVEQWRQCPVEQSPFKASLCLN